jgi:hypothetical protein
MWNLIVHAPDSDPKVFELKDGKTSVGAPSAAISWMIQGFALHAESGRTGGQ